MNELYDIIRQHDDFVLAGHVNPDGDAIGSCLALGLALERAKKRVSVLLEPFGQSFDMMPGTHLLYRGELTDVQTGVFICLDCASPDRLGRHFEPLYKRAPLRVNIDHHKSNNLFGDYSYVDPEASSTCELVYKLLKPFASIDRDIATALYTGIVTDTGGFRHGCTGSDTLKIAGSLIETGIPFSDIYNEQFHRHSFVEAKIFARSIENAKLTPDGMIAFSYLTYGQLREQGASSHDLEGIVEYLLNTRGVHASLLLYEKHPGILKASYRSKELDVGEIAQGHGGGGHRNASGCNLNGDIKRMLTKLVDELQNALKIGTRSIDK